MTSPFIMRICIAVKQRVYNTYTVNRESGVFFRQLLLEYDCHGNAIYRVYKARVGNFDEHFENNHIIKF